MKNNLNNNKNKWLVFVGISGQMGLTIFFFYKLGSWLQYEFPISGVNFEKITTLLGVFLAIYTVISQVIHISNKNQ